MAVTTCEICDAEAFDLVYNTEYKQLFYRLGYVFRAGTLEHCFLCEKCAFYYVRAFRETMNVREFIKRCNNVPDSQL